MFYISHISFLTHGFVFGLVIIYAKVLLEKTFLCQFFLSKISWILIFGSGGADGYNPVVLVYPFENPRFKPSPVL